MDDPEAAWVTFRKHLEATGLNSLHGRTVLELGPGNSTLTALFAKALGAKHTWMIDAQELASPDAVLFDRATKMLDKLGFPVPSLDGAQSVAEILARLNADYLTKGFESLRTIPDGTIDFLFSNAVLEHVRLAHFESTMRETRRVLRPEGVESHQIDFRDHLQNALNNLRFSHRVWESEFMARSGFYTNRLTWPMMKNIFENAGFSVALRSCDSWPDGLPTSQKRMAPPYRTLPPDDLMVMSAHAVLRPQMQG